MRKYTAVSLDRNLVAQIDDFVKNDPFCLSRAEFIRRAIYSFIEEGK